MLPRAQVEADEMKREPVRDVRRVVGQREELAIVFARLRVERALAILVLLDRGELPA